MEDSYEYGQKLMMMNHEDQASDLIPLMALDESEPPRTLLDDHVDGNEMKNKMWRKHRYAFQTRSQVDILDDGYRWRKYGQKAVKNNTFPRSYYKCTHKGCNVKKQVQRLSKDEGIVITTYDGIHSHPDLQNSTDNFDHILTHIQIYPFLSQQSHIQYP